MHIDAATDEIYLLVASEGLIEDEVRGVLADAADQGVSIFVEVPSRAARDEPHERLPDARVAVVEFGATQSDGSERRPGRLLLVDNETVLMSVQREGLVPSHLTETGVWGSAVGRGLVSWMRELLAARRERMRFETASR